jgi:hypothetical protein
LLLSWGERQDISVVTKYNDVFQGGLLLKLSPRKHDMNFGKEKGGIKLPKSGRRNNMKF